ncbi:MAG: hypothetical protein ACLPY1_15905 [Terracidiphilus sp.]
MSFQAFMHDPKGYCGIHEMQLNGSGANLVPAAITRAAPVANAAHGTSIQYTHIGNVTMNLAVQAGDKTSWAAPSVAGMGRIALSTVRLMNKRSVTYVPAVGGAFPNLRILPWSGTDVTFMQLNGGADFAVTGPLTGCTVSVVRHAGALWFFHANFAGGGGMAAVNHATKRQMIQNAGALVGIPVGANYVYCEYGPGHTYNGLGFVWGRERGGGVWKFYVHAIQPAAVFGNATEDRKWAEL